MPGSWLATAAGAGAGVEGGADAVVLAVDDSCPSWSSAPDPSAEDAQPVSTVRVIPSAATALHLGLTRTILVYGRSRCTGTPPRVAGSSGTSGGGPGPAGGWSAR